MLHRIRNAASKLAPVGQRRRIFGTAALDVALCGLGIGLVYAVAASGGRQVNDLPWLFALFGVACFAHVGLLLFRRIYRLDTRYLGFYDAAEIAGSSLFPAAIVAYGQYDFQFLGRTSGVGLVFILYFFLSSSLLIAARLVHRQVRRSQPSEITVVKQRIRALIVGAGDAGDLILREFERQGKNSALVVGFIDDDPEKAGLKIRGVPVLGSLDEITRVVDTYRVDEILLAIPRASGAEMRRVFELCGRTNAKVRTLPGLQDLITTGAPLTKQLREIRIEDLLRRDPVVTDLKAIGDYMAGRTILITGGGGSIGSELARQVARMKPSRLVLVGKGENSLYEIEQELAQSMNFMPITVVADVRDVDSMRKVFSVYEPDIVFHAAAHKHVPLMEKNVMEAVRNNVLGTLNCARLAIEFGAEKFTLVSSDKAVQPSNVMGATKKLCEMVVCALNATSLTSFTVVRFGNVLGSRGSLVPLLNAQIRRGGPITITHPQMTRYFMSIPEAAQLVLQTGTLGKGGDIFILDMGEPVRIEDIALELIRLHGFMPGDDIAVKYIGIRPGEKLHEELVSNGEELEPTEHEKIRVVQNADFADIAIIEQAIGVLIQSCLTSDNEEAKELLMTIIEDPRQVVAPVPSEFARLR